MIETVIQLVDITELSDEDIFHTYKDYISVQRKMRLEKLKGQERMRSLGAGILLRRLMRLEGMGLDYPVSVGEHGKPFLEGRRDIRFSLSHAGNFAGILFCRTDGADAPEVGMDIQDIRQSGREEAMSRRVLSEKEEAIFRSLPEERRRQYFYEHWSMKESYLKAVGTGLSVDMREVYIAEDRKVYYKGKRTNYELQVYPFIPGYVLTSCMPTLVKSPDEVTVIHV